MKTRSAVTEWIAASLVLLACSIWLFDGGDPAAGSGGYSIVYSVSSDRIDPSPLVGATVSGNIYAFTAPDTDVTQVRFYLNDQPPLGAPIQTENNPPYDFAGGSVGRANAFDTGDLPDGVNLITAEIDTVGGVTETATADFTILNGSPGTPTPTPTGGQPSTISNLGIDMDSSGNSARTAVGTETSLDTCAQVNVGETLSIDVFVDAAPADRGVSGFEFDLVFNSGDVHATAVDRNQLLATAAGSSIQPFGDSSSTDSSLRAAAVDFGDFGIEPAGASEVGPGILARITLTGQSGTGVSDITLENVTITDDAGAEINVDQVAAAQVASNTSCSAPPTPTPSPSPTPGPDNRSDIGIYVPATGHFWVTVSTGSGFGETRIWSADGGAATDERHIGDFDGDGLDDLGLYIPSAASGNGRFWVALSDGGSFGTLTEWTLYDGHAGWGNEIRYVGDYNGDGKSDVGIYVPGDGRFWVSTSNGAGFTTTQAWLADAGDLDDERHIGDFDGDGTSDIGLYVAESGAGNGRFWVAESRGGFFDPMAEWTTYDGQAGWGNETRHVGDYDGDGNSDLGIYVPGSGHFWVARSTGSGLSPTADWTLGADPAGTSIDERHIADFDGDGKADVGVWDYATARFWVALSSGGSFAAKTDWTSFAGKVGWGNEIRLVGGFD